MRGHEEREDHDAAEVKFLMDLAAGLAVLELSWRCQLGSDRFARCVEHAHGGDTPRPEGFKALPDFGWVASDMVAWTGDPRWYSNAPGPRYGPHQEVDDAIPF